MLDLRYIRENADAVAQNLAETLIKDKEPARRDRGIKLFRGLWHAFRRQRYVMLLRNESTEIWQLPELFDDILDEVLPTRTALRWAFEWGLVH